MGTMRHYFIFGGYELDNGGVLRGPEGGWYDLKNSCAKLSLAKETASELLYRKRNQYDWAHVVERKTGDILYQIWHERDNDGKGQIRWWEIVNGERNEGIIELDDFLV